MKRICVLASLFLAVAVASPASAWGWRGHEVVGSIADKILKGHPTAYAQVHALLGSYDLATAATWADCVKDVKHSASNGFTYAPGPRSPAVCQTFANDSGRMVDYVSRNWSNCVYVQGAECHGAFHFADVAIQRDHYAPGEVGTGDHDVVSAINAAILVLKGQPAPAPFNIKDKAEALLLLAHFVGDLHQPLHVGAIYLDAQGRAVDPDALGVPADDCATGAKTYCTVGGNNLMTGPPGSKAELHGEWDTVSSSFKIPASAALVSEAHNFAATSGDPSQWAATWATDTLQQAKVAYQGITFDSAEGSAAPYHWRAHFADRSGYNRTRSHIQRTQLEKAGAHLAALLVALCDQPHACE